LEAARIRTLIFNHQLCLLDERVWHLAVQSISDWKNVYQPACATCGVQGQCGGFFASMKYKTSTHIHPILRAADKLPIPVVEAQTSVPLTIRRGRR
jgi:hypothetical protein